MGWLERAFRAIATAQLWLAAVLVVLMTGFVVLSAIMRYLIGSPFDFTEELVGLLFVAQVFLTIPISTLRREHIAVMGGPARAGLRGKAVLALLAEAVMIAFVLWFTIDVVEFTTFSRGIGARSEQVEILLWPWMAVMGLTMALSLGASAIHVVQATAALRGGAALPAQHEAKELA